MRLRIVVATAFLLGCRALRGDDDAGSADAALADAGRGELAICRVGCDTPSDCGGSSAAFDADNYTCEGGACRYSGCVGDVECQSSFADARYVCRAVPGGVAACALGCSAAVDCTSPSPAFDADNYRCEGRACVYAGCNDDEECAATLGPGHGCRVVLPPNNGAPLPLAARNCVRLCAQAADCASDSGAFSADNFACEGGACVWIGCEDDAECRTSLGAASICRP